jgi:hypothetical protein
VLAFLTSVAETNGYLVHPVSVRSDRALRFAKFLEAIYRAIGSTNQTLFPSDFVRMFSESLLLNGDLSDQYLGYKPKITLSQACRFMNGLRHSL